MRITIIAALIIFAAKGYAYTVSNRTINLIHVNFSSGIYFSTTEAMVSPDNCSGSVWYKLADDIHSKEALSLLLAAKVSKQKINFSLNGCSGGYPQATWINF